MSRPLLLDLFCGAGGCSVGYSRAGFDVVGVDIRPQPRYPFAFHQADAMTFPLGGYDAIHASPPCQRYSTLTKQHQREEAHPDLVAPVRTVLRQAGTPYVIENVQGSPLRRDIVLCGTMFGLGVDGAQLRRHRWFETNWALSALVPPCSHKSGPVCGVYGGGGGDGRRRPRSVAGGFSTRDGVQHFSTRERAEAMGIDWMTGDELSEAIPPAYTEFIGKQMLTAIARRSA